LSTVLTDKGKNIIFPPKVTIHKYVRGVIFGDKDAFEINSNELLFKRPNLKVNENTRLHIWNTNDLGGDQHDRDNDGRHCVKVFAKYKF